MLNCEGAGLDQAHTSRTPRPGKDKELFAREFSFLRRQWVREEIMRIFYRVIYQVKPQIFVD